MKVIIKNMVISLLFWIWYAFNTKKNNKYFFVGRGIGDTLYSLIYMKAYRDKNPNQKIIYIIKKSHLPIVNMYKKYVDDTKITSDFWFEVIRQYYLNNKNKKCRIIHAHPYAVVNEPDAILGIKGISLLDLYKLALNLPNDTTWIKPEVENKSDEVIAIENELKNKKAILLCPYSVTTPMVEQKNWEELASEYLKEDYIVYTNVKDKTEKEIKGTKRLSLNLQDTYCVASKFERIYAIRSGICDLLALANTKLTIYYPADKKNDMELFTYKRFNMKLIGLRDDIEEIIL